MSLLDNHIGPATATADPADTSPPAPAVAAGVAILVVDDSPVDRRLIGRLIERRAGWRAEYAADGAEALDRIAASRPAAVVTDMQMPRLDGLELVGRIRAEYPGLPVVLMTGLGSEEVALQALSRGAVSYVPKRLAAGELVTTLEPIVEAAALEHRRGRVLGSLDRCALRFRLENDPALVPEVIARVLDLAAPLLADPSDAVRLRLALVEALHNALYHGNLALDSAIREEDDRLFYRMAAERREQEPYRSRRITLAVAFRPDRLAFAVADEGAGFDPSHLPDPTDPVNLERVSGRGLFLIRTFLDEVAIRPPGNRIDMIKRRGLVASRVEGEGAVSSC